MKLDWNGALTIFVGTLPLLGAILWNLLKIERIETRLDKIQEKLVDILQRLSKLEGKIEGKHLIIE